MLGGQVHLERACSQIEINETNEHKDTLKDQSLSISTSACVPHADRWLNALHAFQSSRNQVKSFQKQSFSWARYVRPFSSESATNKQTPPQSVYDRLCNMFHLGGH
jgi:hypothetical protein